jgi:hypothetical protein
MLGNKEGHFDEVLDVEVLGANLALAAEGSTEGAKPF